VSSGFRDICNKRELERKKKIINKNKNKQKKEKKKEKTAVAICPFLLPKRAIIDRTDPCVYNLVTKIKLIN